MSSKLKTFARHDDTLIIPALLKQENGEFEASLGYIVRLSHK
jgi:hypothetical protein